MVRRRAFGARACLAAIALALLVVPGLHALVHIREAEHRGHHHRDHVVHVERGARAERGQRSLAPVHAHEYGDQDQDGHGPPPHHHHGGRPHRGDQSPVDHGDGAPEHLGIALLESEPPPVPEAGQAVDSLVPPAPVSRIAAAPRTRAHGCRAPPADPASRNRT